MKRAKFIINLARDVKHHLIGNKKLTDVKAIYIEYKFYDKPAHISSFYQISNGNVQDFLHRAWYEVDYYDLDTYKCIIWYNDGSWTEAQEDDSWFGPLLIDNVKPKIEDYIK